jgi:4-hydroxy-3-methylbut-2-enyl diphosphate reductase
VTTIGVTSGASVPEELVAAVLDKLAGHGFGDVEEVEAVEEQMTFALPRELRAARAAEATAPAAPAGPAGPGSRQPG